MPLARSAVMNNVIRIVGENIPDVEAIDFSKNRLPRLEHFSMLAENSPAIKSINLAGNRLSDVAELDKLSRLKNLQVGKSRDDANFNEL